jgi:hypothetical protein
MTGHIFDRNFNSQFPIFFRDLFRFYGLLCSKILRLLCIFILRLLCIVIPKFIKVIHRFIKVIHRVAKFILRFIWKWILRPIMYIHFIDYYIHSSVYYDGSFIGLLYSFK